jgi:hypothetical protein
MASTWGDSWSDAWGDSWGSIVAVPVADFSGTPLSGEAPLSVAFTDLSTNTPTSWLWDFGDASTSTSQNPTHVYTVAGTYTVVLTATNSAGSNAKTRTAYVVVSAVPVVTPTVGGIGGFPRMEQENRERWARKKRKRKRQLAVIAAWLMRSDDEDLSYGYYDRRRR